MGPDETGAGRGKGGGAGKEGGEYLGKQIEATRRATRASPPQGLDPSTAVLMKVQRRGWVSLSSQGRGLYVSKPAPPQPQHHPEPRLPH